MPLCCLQSLPGTLYSLTESLSIVVPNSDAQVEVGVENQYWKEVREGRAAFHDASTGAQGGDSFSIETLTSICKTWREQGIFSFIEVRFSGQIEEKEMGLLKQLKQAVDWLILDATSKISISEEVLQAELWSHQARVMQEIGKKVGLRLAVDPQVPVCTVAPWIAKAALDLGEPGFLFLEAGSTELTVSLIREVQDLLYHHPLSKGSARIIPVLCSSSHSLAEKSLEVLDFPSLDALLIESNRPFFGGVSVHQEERENLFNCSLWQVVVAMITQKRSSSSFVEHSMSRLKWIPCDLRMPLLRSMCALSKNLSVKDPSLLQREKEALEMAWAKILQECIEMGEGTQEIKAAVAALLNQSSEAITLLRRKSVC